MIIFNIVNTTLDIGINKLNRVNSPNKDAKISLYILLYLFNATFIVSNSKKSNKKLIIINKSIYIIILSPTWLYIIGFKKIVKQKTRL